MLSHSSNKADSGVRLAQRRAHVIVQHLEEALDRVQQLNADGAAAKTRGTNGSVQNGKKKTKKSNKVAFADLKLERHDVDSLTRLLVRFPPLSHAPFLLSVSFGVSA